MNYLVVRRSIVTCERFNNIIVKKMKLDELPGDCFSEILSLTSPGDAIRASAVSSVVRLCANSDDTWGHFLPSDWQEILARSVSPVAYNNKKELFLKLCNPLSIDRGTKILSLDRSTTKKIYMLSARELSITWACNRLYWSWKPHHNSRFAEVVELITSWWLQIEGKFNTQMLSPSTNYGAYLIVKFAKRAYGLDTLPSEASLEVGNFKSKGKVYLRCPSRNKPEAVRTGISRSPRPTEGEERKDGWVEIELGRFYNDGLQDKEVIMSLKEVTSEQLKGGLIVEGIELRPT